MGLVMGQFSESFPPIMDGVGNVAKNYAYWLNKKYGSCYVITPHFPNHTDNEDFEVLRYSSISIPTRYPYRTGIPKLCAPFMKRLKQIPFDIVHAHTPFSSGNIALDTARRRGIPIVASFHSKYYDDFLESLKFEGAARFVVSKVVDFYNSVDAVWTVNRSTAETLREYGYKGTIEEIPNGTEYETVKDKEAECEKINSQFGFTPDQLVFIYVGQMIRQKNTRTLIESLALLKQRGLDFKMLMIGQGYALEELKALSKSLDLDDRVSFLGPIYDREYLKSIYCRANLLIFPSLYDNASIVVREAASQCCPAVLVEGSNTSEGITDDFNGFLTKDGAENIANRIMKAVENPKKLVEVGRYANKTVYTNWESIVDEVYGRYMDIIKVFSKLRA